ncbi:MAG: polymerase subunit beta [Chlamydiales bacterium]|jgi:DNA polymerase-3 subunit beta|nr:polymerase subunit beta [Chlamydiales bacterium]
MHFIVSKTELSQLVSKIQNIVPQKPMIPILSNILVEAKANELIITATDLTVGVRFFIPAKVLEEGSTTLPGRRFFQLIRELTSANLEIITNNNEVSEILAHSSRFKLNGMNKKDYPALPDLTGAINFDIDTTLFKEMISRTTFAVARDDSRYTLNGVLFEISGGELSVVTTDGKRLAKMSTSITLDPTFARQYILPLKAVEEIGGMLSDSATSTVYLMDDKVAVESNQGLIITKLLAGDYPDYRRVIPQNPTLSISLHREELMTLLRQVALFTTETSCSVKFSFTSGELKLLANHAEIGEGKVSMAANYQGNPLDIAFSPVFFLDILRHCKDETINLSLTDAFNPVLITDSSSALFVIMPMRLIS